jgi:hypothetical protein
MPTVTQSVLSAAQQAAVALVLLPTQSSRLPNLQAKKQSLSGSDPARSHVEPALNPAHTN